MNKEETTEYMDNLYDDFMYIDGKDKKIDKLIKDLDNDVIDINSKDKDGFTFIHIACFVNDVKLLNTLIDRGADTQLYDDNGELPIHLACSYNCKNVLKKLINIKVPLNSLTLEGENTPYQLAFDNNHYDIILMLIRAGLKLTEEETDELLQFSSYLASLNESKDRDAIEEVVSELTDDTFSDVIIKVNQIIKELIMEL